MSLRRNPLIVLAVLVLATGIAGAARGQGTAPPNAMQGFAQNKGQPVKIDADALEVRDKNKVATFTGNVKMIQGDTVMQCKVLVVYYDNETTPGGTKAAQPGPAGQQQIRKIEAKGNVIVTQKDQTASGDTGIFEMSTNTVTLIGNVTITQKQNVMKAERLVTNMTTGVSELKGRVSALVVPGGSGADAKLPGAAPAPQAAPTPQNSAAPDRKPIGPPKPAQRPQNGTPSGLY
jgi:lipopolysaccharide export system protein LptA